MSDGPTAPWTSSVAEVAVSLDADLTAGLTEAEAAARLLERGPNTIEGPRTGGLWRVVVRQFTNTMILILAAAGVVTFFVGERLDTLVIGVIVVGNAAVGVVQEYRAERAMDELDELTTATATVVRDGVTRAVPAPDLVPGDLVRLAAGDVVPADLRLSVAASLQVAEAALTGESEPVGKQIDASFLDSDFVGDRRNMAYKGTAVADGRGEGIVVATGMATEIGHIAQLLTEERVDTPLQRRLAVLGRRLAAIALVLCGVVFLSGLVRGEEPDEMLVAAISLAVAAVPEGLPAVVTVALALGARRMARHHALVRRLPAVETLGTVGVICSDKTGTLTQNRMAVERVWTPMGDHVVSDRPRGPVGPIVGDAGEVGADLRRVAAVAWSCNDASVTASDDGERAVTGDPTEVALLELARRCGVDSGPPRVGELAFDPDRRRMATVHLEGDGGVWIAVKGALDSVGPLLAGGEPLDRAELVAEELAADGYRVLALAERHTDRTPSTAEETEQHLELVGVVGISDPPRPGTRESVETCRRAGISTVMITGDHPRTAAAIARRLGILRDGDGDGDGDGDAAVATGSEISDLRDDELTERVGAVRVYARTAPAQKLRIVEAWRRRGAVVAMTGDGVNDAPALHRADIGVAMGEGGTDVSREAADMVLTDDDFTTVVRAVAEGRRIYDNLRRFVLYLLATNSAEVMVMLLGPFLGLPLPLTATQILYVNLVTDGLPAVALGLEPPEPDVMGRSPRPRDESILGDGLWQRALAVGASMAAAVLALQVFGERAGLPWQTMGFVALAVLQLTHAVTVRSGSTRLTSSLRTNPLLVVAVSSALVAQLAVVYVPFLRSAFDTEALSPGEVAIVTAICGLAFVIGEVDRVRRRRRATGPSSQDRGREDAGTEDVT